MGPIVEMAVFDTAAVLHIDGETASPFLDDARASMLTLLARPRSGHLLPRRAQALGSIIGGACGGSLAIQ